MTHKYQTQKKLVKKLLENISKKNKYTERNLENNIDRELSISRAESSFLTTRIKNLENGKQVLKDDER